MPNLVPSVPAAIETPAERFRRLVAGIAERLDQDFPAAVIPPAAGGIDDDSAFYGSDDGRPAFVAADDAAWRG